MPVQGWDFDREITSYQPGITTVAIGPFLGEPRLFAVQGPLSEAECEERLDGLKEAEIMEPQGSSADNHIEKVEAVIERIRRDGLRKVVIARKELLDLEIDIAKVFYLLCAAYPKAIVYVLHLEGEVWVGATPETLLTAGEEGLRTMSLAGTRRPDGPEFTEKEYDEQLAVTESIEDILLGLGCSKIDARGPVPVSAGPIEHLQTVIEASLPSSGSSIDWAKALHPTPAVCGMPKKEALEIIGEIEDFDRSLYAGFIGWISDENARYYVNLRCMQVGKKHVALYAGGGITAQSDAKAEFAETVNKLETLKSVIQTEH